MNIMNIELIKLTNESFLQARKNKTYTKFSDMGAAGSYDFLSQVILLNSVEKRHIDDLQQRSKTPDINYYNIAKNIFPLLSHEQAHWVDNTSTLWGFEFLEKIFESLAISTSEQVNGHSEYEFHKKKTLYDEIHCIRYPKYYSITGNSVGARPWAYQYSMGKLFDVSGKPSEYPMFFTRFNDLNGELISREPFALCSLFESSATYQELLTEVACMRSILHGDELLVEERLLNEKYMSRIYDKDLTEYSVAAHKISNELRLDDVLEAYSLSASISHVSLNFPTDYFDEIKPEAIYGTGHDFLEGIKLALKLKDRAVLYMVLSDAVSLKNKEAPVSSKNIKETIEAILSDFDISLNEMSNKVEERMTEISTNICAKYQDEYTCNLMLNGIGRFKKIGVMAEGPYPFEELKAPGAILGDDHYLNPYEHHDANYEDRYLNQLSFLEHLISFSEACVYNAREMESGST